MGMVLPIKGSCLKPSTLPNSGTYLVFLCVRIMDMEWVPVLRELQPVHSIIPEEIIYQEYGLVFTLKNNWKCIFNPFIMLKNKDFVVEFFVS